MSRRMFVAVLPPADAVDELARQLAPDDGHPLRWTPRSQWHVTLLFTPAVAEESVGPYTDALSTMAATVRPFELAVSGGGAFPRVAAARHLIALLDDPSSSLARLARGCRAAAGDLGIDHDERPYQPHLTLARLNRAADRTADRAWLAALHTGPWRVTDVALVESRLDGPNHTARHTVVERLPLAR